MVKNRDVKHRKRRREDDSSDDDELAPDLVSKHLEAYGERFMSMFEPTETDTKRKKKKTEEKKKSIKEKASTIPTDNDDEDNTLQSDEDDDAQQPKTNKSSDKDIDIVEYIFNKKATVKSTSTTKKPSTTTAHNNDIDALQEKERLLLERKRFMSHKASNIVSEIPSLQQHKKGKNNSRIHNQFMDDDSGMTREEFEKLKREINLYGATALDKKAKSRFTSSMLQELGAKQEKGPMMSAKIGHGIAKKRAKREAEALEEAIAAGMVKRKGLGKKKRAEKRAGLDRGLVEDGGAFSGGVLRVHKMSGGKGMKKRR